MPAMSVSVKPAVYIDLENAVTQTGFTKSKIVEKALEQYLLELKEDKEDALAGENAWNEFVNSGKKAIPADDVYKNLDI